MKKYMAISSSGASLQQRPTPLASTAQSTAEDYFPTFSRLAAKGEAQEEIALLIDFLELQSGYAA